MGIRRSAQLDFSWLANLGAMIDHGTEIQVFCDCCGLCHNFTTQDLEALAAKVDLDYSLFSRRCKCRLTAGCMG